MQKDASLKTFVDMTKIWLACSDAREPDACVHGGCEDPRSIHRQRTAANRFAHLVRSMRLLDLPRRVNAQTDRTLTFSQRLSFPFHFHIPAAYSVRVLRLFCSFPLSL